MWPNLCILYMHSIYVTGCMYKTPFANSVIYTNKCERYRPKILDTDDIRYS